VNSYSWHASRYQYRVLAPYFADAVQNSMGACHFYQWSEITLAPNLSVGVAVIVRRGDLPSRLAVQQLERSVANLGRALNAAPVASRIPQAEPRDKRDADD
jgi:hypothetical protein